jgi:predicted transcriptional regulator of viral defense system
MLKTPSQEQIEPKCEGIFTLAELNATGMSAMNVSRAVKRGDLLRISHGLYISPDYDEFKDDEMFIAQLRYKQIIFSHDTALYLHGLNDRDPLNYSVTVPTGHNTKKLTANSFKVFSLKQELYNQDIEEIATIHGNMIWLYNVERTICDCIRSRRRLQSEIVMSGIKAYVRRSDRNMNSLMKMAEKFRVSALLRTYMEVLT